MFSTKRYLMLNIFQEIFNHIQFFDFMNIFMDFIVHIFTMIFFISSILTFLHNHQLKHVFSKNDLKNLRYYVTTYADEISPSSYSELNKEVKRFNLIHFFMNDVFKKDTYGKYFIVLAESGMGKSTFLQMLFIKYRNKLIKTHKIYFYPLTNNMDTNKWKAIKNKNNSILLLDALDEDSLALKNYEERIKEITEASQEFYKVIITCRTQFFPNEQSEPKNTFLINYNTKNKKQEFYKLYISKFNNEDIDTFLKKRYRLKKDKRIQAKKIINKCTDLMARPMILASIDDLLKSPENYSCISDIYEKLIYEWLYREPVNYDLLKQFTDSVMRYMFEHNVLSVTKNIIVGLCKKDEIEIINPILAHTRSLLTRNSMGEYRFSHKSIFEYLISYEAIYNDTSIRKKLLMSENYIELKFYREMSYKQVKDGCKKLSYLDLRNADLRNIMLNNVTLTGSNLSNINLFGVNLSGSDLSNAIFNNTDLTYANLAGANLSNVNLSGMDLSGIDLCGADLSNAILKNTILAYANLSGANLFGVNLTGADLTGANLSRAILKNTNLTYANLSKTNLSNLDLSDIGLSKVNLLYQDLKLTDLNSIILKNTEKIKNPFDDLDDATFSNYVSNFLKECEKP